MEPNATGPGLLHHTHDCEHPQQQPNQVPIRVRTYHATCMSGNIGRATIVLQSYARLRSALLWQSPRHIKNAWNQKRKHRSV